MKDFLGNNISVGDTVLYPGRQSSSVWMVAAEVISFGEEQRYGRAHQTMLVKPFSSSNGFSRSGKNVKLTSLENVVKVQI